MDLSGNRRGPPRTEGESIEDATARAVNAPTLFNPKERAAYVRAMVNRVIEYRRERKSAEDIRERLPEFAEEYKHLFEMLTAPEGFDQQNLTVMLAMLDRMGQGGLTQHEASVIVGKRLFDKYGGDKR
jgi:hypothetical protein